MDRIYPQDATSSLSSVRRRDEKPTSANLDQDQLVAEVGDTIPLAFTKRENDAGGVWLQGLLVRLGFKEPNLSLIYLLSQGEIGLVALADIYYGATKYSELGTTYCQAYQALPPCVDATTGNVSWTQTATTTGPSLPAAGAVASVTSQSSRCIKLSLKIIGDCYIEWKKPPIDDALGKFPSGLQFDYLIVNYNFAGQPDSEIKWVDTYSRKALALSPPAPWSSATIVATGNNYVTNTSLHYDRWTGVRINTEVRYSWRMIRTRDGVTVSSGSFWMGQGGGVFATPDLPPDKYRLELFDRYEERNAVKVTTYTTQNFRYYSGAGQYIDLTPQGQAACNGANIIEHFNKLILLNQQSYRDISAANSTDVEIDLDVDVVTETTRVDAGLQPDNQQSGTFSDLTLLGIKADKDTLLPIEGNDYFKQLTVFCREGIKVRRLLQSNTSGSSNNYADLVWHLLSKVLRADQIDEAGLRKAALFTQQYGLRFDGILRVSSNLQEWLNDTAPMFLCSFVQDKGKVAIIPSLPTAADGSVIVGEPAIAATFDEATVLLYERQYAETSLRKPFVAVMVFTEQDEARPGGTVAIEVRYTGQALAGPFEQYDLSEFCVTRAHAERTARYLLARRRYVTHAIRFSATQNARLVAPGDVVRVAMATMGDSHLYQVERITEDQAGVVEIEATHYPLTSDGKSAIAAAFADATIEAK